MTAATELMKYMRRAKSEKDSRSKAYLWKKKRQFDNELRSLYYRTPNSLYRNPGIVGSRCFSDREDNTTLNVGTLFTNSITEFITAGDTVGTRSSDKIYITGIRIQGIIYNSNTANGDRGHMRMAIVENKLAHSSIGTDTFKYQGSSNAPINYVGTGDALQLVVPLNNNKFKVYKNKKLPIYPNDVGSGQLGTFVNFYQPIKRVVTYTTDGTDMTYPDLTFFYFVEKDNSTGSFTGNIQFRYLITVYYRDL